MRKKLEGTAIKGRGRENTSAREVRDK